MDSNKGIKSPNFLGPVAVNVVMMEVDRFNYEYFYAFGLDRTYEGVTV